MNIHNTLSSTKSDTLSFQYYYISLLSWSFSVYALPELLLIVVLTIKSYTKYNVFVGHIIMFYNFSK